jgi:hypothetical protein
MADQKREHVAIFKRYLGGVAQSGGGFHGPGELLEREGIGQVCLSLPANAWIC